MRHADAEIQLLIANDRLAREWREAERASLLRSANSAGTTIRQRAGHAVIAVGERLAGGAVRGGGGRTVRAPFA
jgi:hypothetical protein